MQEISVKQWWSEELSGKGFLCDHILKGGQGSGSWNGPGSPRFAADNSHERVIGARRDWKNLDPNLLTETEIKEIKNWGMDNRKNANLTSPERSAIIEYRGSSAFEINDFLRGGKIQFMSEKDANKIVGHVDSAISKAIIDRNIVTYRGVPLDLKVKVGDTIKDKAFLSTTMNIEEAVNFSNGPGNKSTIFKIEVPKGSRGLYVEGMAPRGYEMNSNQEHEILFPRNTQIQITEVIKLRGTYYVSGKIEISRKSFGLSTILKGGVGSGIRGHRTNREESTNFSNNVKVEGLHKEELQGEVSNLFNKYPSASFQKTINEFPLTIKSVDKLSKDRYGETSISNDAVTIKIAESCFSHEKGEPSIAGDVLRHEIGHYVEKTTSDQNLSKMESLFVKLANNTNYPKEMKVNSREFFAESFARYTSDSKQDVVSIPKQMASFIDTFLQPKKSLGLSSIIKIGTAASGNFGHAGRQDQVGGSSAGKGNSSFKETKLVDGKRVMSDGSPLPVHITNLKIAPAWTDVKINPDPNAGMWVQARDSKRSEKFPEGRSVSIYNPVFKQDSADVKFARVLEMLQKFGAIKKENETNSQSSNPKVQELAAVSKLIMETGIRAGSERDTGAAKQAYGATTLLGKHVIEDEKGVHLEFVGKKGKDLSIPINDKAIAAMVVERAKNAGSDQQLFKVNDSQLRSYTKQFDGGGFLTKDIRTAIGNLTAINKIKEYGDRKPRSEKEYKKMVKEVAIAVSRKLGNTPVVALQSYINPVVFKGWAGYGSSAVQKMYGLATIFKGGVGSGIRGHRTDRSGQVGRSGKGGNETTQKFIAGIANTDMAKEIREKFATDDYFGEGGIAGLAKAEGLSPKEYQDKVEKFLKDELKKTPVAIRVNETILSKILDDDKVKNQFETGETGQGKSVSQRKYNDARSAYEEKVYGMNKSTPASDHPVYGYYVRDKDETNPWLEDYGKIALMLHNEIKDRSTFTDSDSLDLNYSSPRLYPSPANNPSIYSTFGISNNTEVISANTKHVAYWEAQIFGGIKTSDIAKVKFYTEPSNEILSKLDKHGIKYEVVK